AAPVQLDTRDVWVPKILDPTATTVWQVGGTFIVEWALDQEPASVTNPVGTVYLSKAGILDIDNPLAEGFQLTDGSVPVTVPEDTVPGSDYSVVLVGDSGNSSPTFVI
ncbi:hypothetical protein BJ322DRAFT_982791, partial [Thelephora terrestris]